MRKSITTIAVLATAAVTAAPALAAPASTPVTIDNCAAHAQVAPRSISLFCGDDGEFLKQITWTGWGRANAKATAVEVYNTCTPDCAAGHYTSKRVRLTVSGLVDDRYTQMTLNGERWDLTRRGAVVA